jgi:hypothetical protein
VWLLKADRFASFGAQRGSGRLQAESPPAHVREPHADAVSGALERLLASVDFDASPRSSEFLRHVVEETVAGLHLETEH